MYELRVVQVFALEKLAEQRFLETPALQCRRKQPAVNRDAVRYRRPTEMARGKRDVSRDVDRVKVNDVGPPRQNALGEVRVRITPEEPTSERAAAGLQRAMDL